MSEIAVNSHCGIGAGQSEIELGGGAGKTAPAVAPEIGGVAEWFVGLGIVAVKESLRGEILNGGNPRFVVRHIHIVEERHHAAVLDESLNQAARIQRGWCNALLESQSGREPGRLTSLHPDRFQADSPPADMAGRETDRH